MHNGAKYTADALQGIIDGLKEKGYSFVTISELIIREDYVIDHTGKQIKKWLDFMLLNTERIILVVDLRIIRKPSLSGQSTGKVFYYFSDKSNKWTSVVLRGPFRKPLSL